MTGRQEPLMEDGWNCEVCGMPTTHAIGTGTGLQCAQCWDAAHPNDKRSLSDCKEQLQPAGHCDQCGINCTDCNPVEQKPPARAFADSPTELQALARRWAGAFKMFEIGELQSELAQASDQLVYLDGERQKLRTALRIARDFIIALDYESMRKFEPRRVEMVQSIDTILGEP